VSPPASNSRLQHADNDRHEHKEVPAVNAIRMYRTRPTTLFTAHSQGRNLDVGRTLVSRSGG
jgi:hypothetical protein